MQIKSRFFQLPLVLCGPFWCHQQRLPSQPLQSCFSQRGTLEKQPWQCHVLLPPIPEPLQIPALFSHLEWDQNSWTDPTSFDVSGAQPLLPIPTVLTIQDRLQALFHSQLYLYCIDLYYIISIVLILTVRYAVVSLPFFYRCWKYLLDFGFQDWNSHARCTLTRGHQ